MFTYGRRHLLWPRKSVRSPDSERFDNVRDDPIVYFRTRSRLNRAHKRTDIGFIGLPRAFRYLFRTPTGKTLDSIHRLEAHLTH